MLQVPKKDFETKHMGIFLAEMYVLWKKKTCFWIIVLHNPWPFLIKTIDIYVFFAHSHLVIPVLQC